MARIDWLARNREWAHAMATPAGGDMTILERFLQMGALKAYRVISGTHSTLTDKSNAGVTAAALDIAHLSSTPQVEITVGEALQKTVLRGLPPGFVDSFTMPEGADIVWVNTPHLNHLEVMSDVGRTMRGFYMARNSMESRILPVGPGWVFCAWGVDGPAEGTSLDEEALWAWHLPDSEDGPDIDTAVEKLVARSAEIVAANGMQYACPGEYLSGGGLADLARSVMYTAFGLMAWLAQPKPDVVTRPPSFGKKPKKRKSRPGDPRAAKEAVKVLKRNRMYIEPAPRLERGLREYKKSRERGDSSGMIAHWVYPYWQTKWVGPRHEMWQVADPKRQNDRGLRPARVLVGAETGGFVRGSITPEKIAIET